MRIFRMPSEVESLCEVFQDDELISTWKPVENWSNTRLQTLFRVAVECYTVRHEKLLQIRFEHVLELHLHDTDHFESVCFYPEGIII